MTIKGFEKLQEEIRHLKNVERPQIVEAIAAARSLGDLSENAEYHSAKDRQGLVEARISDLDEKISRSEISKLFFIELNLVFINYEVLYIALT